MTLLSGFGKMIDNMQIGLWGRGDYDLRGGEG